MRFRSFLPLAAAAALACAATASADSIVYVKDGNVWLSTPDTSRQYQVTFDGGYSSPSQSDNGTIAALHGGQMVRMDRSGRQLNAPVDGMGSPAANTTGTFYGPYEPRISPDGSKIAYWFGQYTSYYSPGCYCNVWRVESQTTWTHADRFSNPQDDTGYDLGITQPEWLTNDRLLAGYPMFSMNLWTWQVGTGTGYQSSAGQYAAAWRDSEGQYYDMGDPALSPDGKELALTDGGDATTNTRLFIASVNGPLWSGNAPYPEPDYLDPTPAADTQLTCLWDFDGKAIWNPTWSPDSKRLAYSLPDGVHIMSNPTTTDCASLQEGVVIAGGAEPDWGPADVNLADKPSPPKGDTGSPAGPGGGPTAPGTPGASAGLTALKVSPHAFRAARRGPSIARRTGTTVTFKLAAPSQLRIGIRHAGGRAVKGSIKSAGKPGANTLRFMGRVARRTLPPGSYTLVVTASPVGGGAAQTSTAPFKIVR